MTDSRAGLPKGVCSSVCQPLGAESFGQELCLPRPCPLQTGLQLLSGALSPDTAATVKSVSLAITKACVFGCPLPLAVDSTHCDFPERICLENEIREGRTVLPAPGVTARCHSNSARSVSMALAALPGTALVLLRPTQGPPETKKNPREESGSAWPPFLSISRGLSRMWVAVWPPHSCGARGAHTRGCCRLEPMDGTLVLPPVTELDQAVDAVPPSVSGWGPAAVTEHRELLSAQPILLLRTKSQRGCGGVRRPQGLVSGLRGLCHGWAVAATSGGLGSPISNTGALGHMVISRASSCPR